VSSRPSRLAAILAASAVSIAAPASARDQLAIGLTQYPATFHPIIEAMVAKSYLNAFAFRRITVYDPDWNLVCMLCERLPSIEEGTAKPETTADGKQGIRVTWRLRADATWGDGTPVTTEDIRFTYELGRQGDTGVGPAEFYRSAYELIIEDDRTFTFRFDKLTFEYASLGDFVPLPAHLERAPAQAGDPKAYRTRTLYDTDTTRPGLWNGPYQVSAVTPGSSVTLSRNAAWKGPKPAFERIVVRAIENTASLEAALLSGQVDMIAGELGLPLDQALALEKRAANRFHFLYKPGLIYEHLDVNLDNKALADKRVRQGLLSALDREAINQRLFSGRQPVANSDVNPLDWVYDPTTPQWPYDPARAIALFEAAGFTQGPDGIRRNTAGERLSFELMSTAGNRSRELVQQVLQAQWKAVGVDIRIRNEPPRVFFSETLNRRRFQALALFAWVKSPENVPRTTLHSTEIPTEATGFRGQNYSGFQNAEMDQLIEDIPVTLDRDKRRALWSRLQALYAEELPALPLFFRSDAHIWPRWLEGVTPTGHLHPSPFWVETWRAAP